MKTSVMSAGKIASTLLALVLFASIATLTRHYFRAAENPDYGLFYKKLPLGGARIAETELRNVTQNASGTPFEQVVVQSAFIRYQVDPSREVFTGYMHQLEHGLWWIPPAAVWAEEFRGITETWSRKRASFLAANGNLGQIGLGRDNASRLAVAFPAPVHTWDVGTSFTVTVTVPDAAVISSAPVYSFPGDTTLLSRAAPRLARWGQERVRGGKIEIDIIFDLSANLSWYLQNDPVGMLIIDGDKVGQWEITSMAFER